MTLQQTVRMRVRNVETDYAHLLCCMTVGLATDLNKWRRRSSSCPRAVRALHSLLWQQVGWRLKQHVVQQVRGRILSHQSDSIPLAYFNVTLKYPARHTFPAARLLLKFLHARFTRNICRLLRVLNLARLWPACPAWSPVCLLGPKHTRFMLHCGQQMLTSGLENTKMKACNIKLEINTCTTKVIISYECF